MQSDSYSYQVPPLIMRRCAHVGVLCDVQPPTRPSTFAECIKEALNKPEKWHRSPLCRGRRFLAVALSGLRKRSHQLRALPDVLTPEQRKDIAERITSGRWGGMGDKER